MARPDDTPGARRLPRPNELADGVPVPNVLRGHVPPSRPGGGSAGRAGAERTPRPAPERAEGRQADERARARVRPRGWGCGSWLALLVFLGLASQLVDACNEILAPEKGTQPAATVPIEATPTASAGSPAGGDGSAAPSASPTASSAVIERLVDPGALATGDCFAWTDQDGTVSTVRLRDCTVAHDAEVTRLVTLPDPPGTAYDDGVVQAAATTACDAAFTDYTGHPASLSAGGVSSFIYPGQGSWEDGDRVVTCLVEGSEPGALVGSARAEGP